MKLAKKEVKRNKGLTPEQKKTVVTEILENPYIPHKPFSKQIKYLLTEQEEALYGGQAGGGKSDAILMDGLRYAPMPGYSGLILRRTFADLNLPGALMDRAMEWLSKTNAKWDERRKTWSFPGGGTLTFGYLETERDKYRYQGTEFDFIAFDELTQFTETQYRYLFSRLRRSIDSDIPSRMRAGTNPGGVGHQWVKQRFIKVDDPLLRPFIPASYLDNPYIDQEDYESKLDRLDYITRMQLKYGDWDVGLEGGMFKKRWFDNKYVKSVPRKIVKKCRFWDLAATKPTKAGRDPDWTVGLLMVVDDANQAYVQDVVRFRGTPNEVEQRILETAEMDGFDVDIVQEEEPGSSGKIVASFYGRLLPGYTFKSQRTSGSKENRAKKISAYSEQGHVYLFEGKWNEAFLEELVAFPPDEGGHDDQVDAFSGAFNYLFGATRKRTRRYVKAV